MTLPVPTIRASTTTDVESLEAFIAPFVEAGRLLPRTTAEMHDLIKHGFLAECEQSGELEIVGFAALEIYSSKLGEIRSLAVDVRFQGQGVGKQLVAECVKRANELDVLEVMAITSMEDFFKACGFDFTLPGEKKALFYRLEEGTSHA